MVPKVKEPGTFEPWKVRVRSGYILGPYGDEIIIDCVRTFDLRTNGLTGITGEPCVDAIDPWCSEVVRQPESDKLYVAVRYKEIPARPVRVQPVGCGCDDASCENSRLVDGYEIGVLTECPDSHQGPPGIDDLTGGPIPDCPPCPDQPWVVLAEVEMDAEGNVIKIDNCVCRRLVVSLAPAWWQCTETKAATEPAPPTGQPVSVTVIKARATLARGVKTVVEMKGENLNRASKASFGPGVTVADLQIPSAERIVAEVAVDDSAQPGKRTLVLTDAAGRTLLKKDDAIEIAQVASSPGATTPTTTKGVNTRASGTTKRRRKPSGEEV